MATDCRTSPGLAIQHPLLMSSEDQPTMLTNVNHVLLHYFMDRPPEDWAETEEPMNATLVTTRSVGADNSANLDNPSC